jgi:NAD(P)-dependent dehydrogenase (short-subunit alcohol dehydrogenase family)
MGQDLQGRTVVIAGGTGVLGRAVVERFLRDGARPLVTWRSERELRESPFADSVRARQLDAGDERAVQEFYAGLGEPLWASVHLVGAFAMSPVLDTSAADFRRMFDVNAMTCFLCCREAVKAMRRSGSAGGRIVNVASKVALVPAGGMIAYGTSKAAVAAITQNLAEEVKPEGVLVNAVLPSIMDTPANRAAMPEADFDAWPKVEQVAEAIAFLASPGNALTSGALLPVYGRS